jgi:outer membrane protein, multidrug efflux system
MTGRTVCLYGLLIVLFSLILTGCMVGPNYSRPVTAANDPNNFANTGSHITDTNDFSTLDHWWESFGDASTAQLVRQALANNYDLSAAAARLLQAQASLEQAHSALWPSLSYSLNRTRNKMSFDLGSAFGGGRFSVLSTTWTQEISTSYVLDIFGKIRRAERALVAETLAVEANRQAMVNTLIATVVSARINIAVLQHQLAILKQNIESQQRTLDIVQQRYNIGLIGPVDVSMAKESLAALKSNEPALEMALSTSRNALDVLFSNRPGKTKELSMSLNDLPDLPALPIGVPAGLIDRRPDIIAAEFSLRAANEQVGVSVAQLLPDLTLTGTYGFTSSNMEDIFQRRDTEIYAAITNLTQPIFDAGRLKAQVKAAKARYQELTAVYASAVLNAIREVEDALITERLLQEQLKQLQIRLNEARNSEQLSQQRYQSGIESILSVLESQRMRRSAENDIVTIQGQIWTARVKLFLALGGDWEPKKKNQD